MNDKFSLIIDGKPVAGEAGTFDVLNPATGELFAACPKASSAQLNQAVASASKAFQSWKRTADGELKATLLRIADRIEANAAEIAELIVREQGKPLFLAQMEVGGAAAWTRYNASLDMPVKVIEDSPKKRIELHYKPLGVIASITPWNWPFLIAVWHIMPALRAGNVVVSKPSEFTPFSTIRLCQIINEEVPPGVISIVPGEGDIGAAIATHDGIDKIVFTGSTATGQKIMASAAGNLKHLTLELGGNDAGIVLADVDVDAVAQQIFDVAFLNAGQTCAALKRLYVHDSIYDALCDKLAAIANAQVVGDGMAQGTTFGPVQNVNQYRKVIALVRDARARGARILSGGTPTEGKGYFLAPTIVADISDGAPLVDEEQFGPALPVIRYTDVDDAVARANNSSFGLGGSVWSSNAEQALKVAQRLECGTIWINGHSEVLPHAPFGGWKMSGLGFEFGQEGLLEYTAKQTVNINK